MSEPESLSDALRARSAIRLWAVASTLAIALLAVVGTLLGLLQEGFYRDPYALVYQAYGQDLVTLVVMVPVLLLGLSIARRGSLRAYFLWLGVLGYLMYTYAVYAVITQFNEFFLGYVALLGLSLYTFVAAVFRLDPVYVKRSLEARLPARLVVAFLVAMGLLVSLLWLSEVIPATLSGTKPESAAEAGLPANVVHVLDLGILLPAVFVTARWLGQGRPWGYVLPCLLFVKLTSIGLAVLGMIVWMWLEGITVELVEIVVFSVLTLANAGLGLVYFRAMRTPTDR